MNKKYLAAIRVIANNGKTIEGNMSFDIDGPLQEAHIDAVKKRYCTRACDNGLHCRPDNAVVFAIIPLEA